MEKELWYDEYMYAEMEKKDKNMVKIPWIFIFQRSEFMKIYYSFQPFYRHEIKE